MASTAARVDRLGQLLLLLLAGSGLSQQAFVAEPASESFYTAGVVEFRQATGGDAHANLADNLAGYLELISSSNASAADIIVFPEMTLNGLSTSSFVPAPEQQSTPCVDDPDGQTYAPFLVEISCAARKVSKYLVININEKQLCSDTPQDTRPCSTNGYSIFNTNVVFDRKGTVVSRYRKVHLYGEPRNSTFLPELVTFETDFDVKFGHFICFDILFFTPAHQLLLEQGVRDFVFPTMWFSQLPFLSAAQVQLGWAYANDVNLLAAGSSRLGVGSTGSGIYHGKRGTLVSVMNMDVDERRIYVEKVPKYQSPAEVRPRRGTRQIQIQSQQPAQQEAPTESQSPRAASFAMKRDALEQYESVWLAREGNVTQEVCHGQLCCHFEVEWISVEEVKEAGYRLGAYDGWRNEQEVDNNYVRICGIFACSGPSIEQCGLLMDAEQLPGILSRVAIEANYPKSREFLLMPNSVQDNLLPLEPAEFEWSIQEANKGNQLSVRFALAKSQSASKLLTFAIYGNYYDEVCSFGTGTPEEDRQCGFVPTGDGAVELGSAFGFWLQLLLAVGVACLKRS